jgi:hypothetical protein
MRVGKMARGEYCNTTAKIEGLFIYSFYDARPPRRNTFSKFTYALNSRSKAVEPLHASFWV